MTYLTFPSDASLRRAASELGAGKAIQKALYALLTGVKIAPTDGGFLCPSFDTAGEVYFISNVDGCECPSRVKPCKHAIALRILELAHARPCGDDVPGDGAPPGDSEPGIGGGEGGNLPPDRPRQINPALVIHLLRERRGLTMPDLRRKKALAEMNELF